MTWTIAGVLGGLLFIELLVLAVIARTVLPKFEHVPPFAVEHHEPPHAARDVTFPTTDGLTLRGSLLTHADRPPVGVVLFAHEFLGNHFSAMAYCRGLWQAGFDILAFDFRNHGASDSLAGYEPLHWVTEYEVDDVLAAVRFLRNHDAYRDLPLGAFGVSRGGGAVLLAASRQPDVRFVACDSAFSTNEMMRHYTMRWKPVYASWFMRRFVPDWHVHWALALARRLSERRRGCRYANFDRGLARLKNRPVLLIHGERDSYAPMEIMRDMASRIGSAAEIWQVAGAKHNRARRVDEREYDRQLIAFFGRMADVRKESPATDVETSLDRSVSAGPSSGTSLPI